MEHECVDRVCDPFPARHPRQLVTYQFLIRPERNLLWLQLAHPLFDDGDFAFGQLLTHRHSRRDLPFEYLDERAARWITRDDRSPILAAPTDHRARRGDRKAASLDFVAMTRATVSGKYWRNL